MREAFGIIVGNRRIFGIGIGTLDEYPEGNDQQPVAEQYRKIVDHITLGILPFVIMDR